MKKTCPSARVRESQCHWAKVHREQTKRLKEILGDFGTGDVCDRVQQLMLDRATYGIKIQRIRDLL